MNANEPVHLIPCLRHFWQFRLFRFVSLVNSLIGAVGARG